MLLTTGVEMTQPVLTKILVDRVIPNANFTLFGWIVAGIAAIHVFGSVFSGTRSYLMGWLGQKAVHDLRERVHAHLQTLSLDFYDQRQTGWIMDRVGNDATNLQRFLSEGLQDFVVDVMTLVVILAIMLTMNRQLALITLLPAPFVFILTYVFMSRVHRLFHASWRARAAMTAQLSNVIPGIRVVKAFAQEAAERERIAIARAILKDPRILILDEATSSVDAETEAQIQEAVERLVNGRTTFAIAHRFSTLRSAGRLIVLENGRLVEMGTREQLLAKDDGVFRRLVDIQAKTNQIVGVGG